ncbi:hypothetical protein GGTG_07077 [Gaeumannomyces tritici R3-111a-1]|uniref:Uncharacterized protein n=1 Tax=Gaeumannomyces tritici (strain R3-111a-1) TaxID=644352 RepID=J3P0N2_GAET3|nr:hypothetical protein GGTG_07077 [Gaeumannomyces tritici R3-111a-1]EJT77165.1 hypothetical protein GGTG_07077 [Gaeumannomyces tritici R3-111a-1]
MASHPARGQSEQCTCDLGHDYSCQLRDKRAPALCPLCRFSLEDFDAMVKHVRKCNRRFSSTLTRSDFPNAWFLQNRKESPCKRGKPSHVLHGLAAQVRATV